MKTRSRLSSIEILLLKNLFDKPMSRTELRRVLPKHGPVLFDCMLQELEEKALIEVTKKRLPRASKPRQIISITLLGIHAVAMAES